MTTDKEFDAAFEEAPRLNELLTVLAVAELFGSGGTLRRGEPEERTMSGLWRYRDDKGKYLVQRRDGTVPEWPYFVLGARDPCSVAALRAYAEEAEEQGFSRDYINDVYRLANEFSDYLNKHKAGDPDAPPHRTEDPEIMAKLAKAKGA